MRFRSFGNSGSGFAEGKRISPVIFPEITVGDRDHRLPGQKKRATFRLKGIRPRVE